MANTVYKKARITGTLGDCLDTIDGAVLVDGDFAFVTYLNKSYVYTYDATASGTEVYPTRITPNTNPGEGRWILLVTNDRAEITATDAELNLLDGLTASTAEVNAAAGVAAGTASESKVLVLGANKNIDTVAIAEGGLKIGFFAGFAVTCSAAELNKMAGVATSKAELGYVVGVTSAIQTQLDAKAATASPAFTGMMIQPFSHYSYDYHDITVNVASTGYLGLRAPYTLPTPTVGDRYTIWYNGDASYERGIRLPAGVTFDGTNGYAAAGEGEGVLDLLAISPTRYLILKNINYTFSA